LSKKCVWSLCLVALALCVSSLPAMAQQTFFTDLGPQGNVYNCCDGWTVSGSGTVGTSFTAANTFTSLLTGSVSQIDLGVGFVTGVNSFYAAIWTDNGGLPGTELGQWNNLSSGTTFGQCCGLVTISNITGLSLWKCSGSGTLIRSRIFKWKGCGERTRSGNSGRRTERLRSLPVR